MKLPPNWYLGENGFINEFGYSPSREQRELAELIGWEEVFKEHYPHHEERRQSHLQWLRSMQKKKREEDEFRKVEEAKRGISFDDLEWVYVLSNPGFAENHYKIGWTSRSPEERARELSKMTALPSNFEVVVQESTIDGQQLEAKVHRALHQHRLPGKEYFVCPLGLIEETIKQQEKTITLKAPRTARIRPD